MNIIERGRAFLQGLRALAAKTAWDWRRCPYCGDTLTCKWGGYVRRPWTFAGRQTVRVQRHRCERCRRTYSEGSALLVRGSWYAREVHRCALGHWQHLGTSARRTAEVVRSWLGKQERWRLWRPLDSPPPDDGAACHLGASTVARWLDRAGQAARRSVPGHLAGVPTAGQLGTDGLWARLRGGATRVVLVLVDSVTGVVWPPVTALGEAPARPWAKLFRRARLAGLDLRAVRGLTSDGAPGLEAHRRRALPWVSHQRCVFHLWRNLAGELARQVATAAADPVGAAAKAVQTQARRALAALVHAVFDAPTVAAAEAALARLAAHDLGAALARLVGASLDAALVYLCGYNRGLRRVAPEWLWRDFRLRLSRGRNHGQDARLERAALVWAIYRNFEPAQGRCERKRKYRRPGQCPLAVAGVPPGDVSYLDALHV
jgi:transposase-like protein